MEKKEQKKIAIINDLSGFGRCSLGVALPIISVMKVQCAIIPTAILSNHTEYSEYSFVDFTTYMNEYIEHWHNLALNFDYLATGFLGSINQIDIVEHFIDTFKCKKILVDPVMGDNGKIYDTYTEEMCQAMKRLVSHAYIITPNLTEACKLTNTPYTPSTFTEEDYKNICVKLSKMGPSKIAITGIKNEDKQMVSNYVYDDGYGILITNHIIAPSRPGTGDVFASILAADMVNDFEFKQSVKKAADFIETCLLASKDMNIPINDGVCFEEFLHDLA